MTKTEARAIVEKFIRAERRMREYVFTRDIKKRDAKLAECDRALAALDVLEPAPTDALPPATLFEMEE